MTLTPSGSGTGKSGLARCTSFVATRSAPKPICPSSRHLFVRESRYRTIVALPMAPSFNEGEEVVVRELLTTSRPTAEPGASIHAPRVGDQCVVLRVLDPDHRTVECSDSDGRFRWVADFHIEELSPALSAWIFSVREISAGAYLASGDGPRKMHVESTDTDPNKSLADCREFALRYPE